MSPPSHTTQLWRRRYQRLLGLYPAEYRRHYAEPTLQLFDDLLRDAPPDAMQRVIRAAVFDTALSIVREQAIAFKQHVIPKEYSMIKRPFYIRHRLPLSIAGGILVIAAILSATTVIRAATDVVRLHRINAIYSSLHIGNDYYMSSESVFGDKRVYSYDKGRTMSSSKIYEHDANVDTTVADVRTKIEAAGFKYFEEPYPGSAQIELHFESKDHHYIRLTVASTRREAAAETGDMNILAAYDHAHSFNEGPSTVTIKVNLDDNNE